MLIFRSSPSRNDLALKQPILQTSNDFSRPIFREYFLTKLLRNITSYRSYWIYSIYKLRLSLKHVASKAAGHPLLRSVEKPKKRWLRRFCRATTQHQATPPGAGGGSAARDTLGWSTINRLKQNKYSRVPKRQEVRINV